MDEFVDKYEVDLNSSYAYGDTPGDLSMLRMVGNPVAINPNKELITKYKKKDKNLHTKHQYNSRKKRCNLQIKS